MTQPRYSDEQKEEALALYLEHGPAEAGRITGISSNTISQWAHRSGVTVTPAQTKAATDAARARREQRREELRDQMLIKAMDLLSRMDEPHKDFKGKDANEVWFDKAPAGACKDYATSAAILVDKFRLELGEVTNRTEEVTTDEIHAFMAGAHQQWLNQGAQQTE